jgi:hypothetical protein
MSICGKGIVHYPRLWGSGQVRLNVLKSDDAVYLCHIKIAILECDAVRHSKTLRNYLRPFGLVVTVGINDGIDLPLRAGSYKHGAMLPQCHRAGVRNILGKDRNPKAWRKDQLAERKLSAGAGIRKDTTRGN